MMGSVWLSRFQSLLEMGEQRRERQWWRWGGFLGNSYCLLEPASCWVSSLPCLISLLCKRRATLFTLNMTEVLRLVFVTYSKLCEMCRAALEQALPTQTHVHLGRGNGPVSKVLALHGDPNCWSPDTFPPKWMWWYVLVIPALGRPKQADF